MKKIFALLLTAAVIVSCNNNPPVSASASAPDTFVFTVTQSTKLTRLPALQSFVFARDSVTGCWLMFSGRTNGFHNFPAAADSSFPVAHANHFAYVYNPALDTLYSMNVSNLPAPLNVQYTFTNLESFQQGNNLYVCGGYGSNNFTNDSNNFVTANIISRINVNAMVTSIIAQNTSGFAASVVFDPKPHPVVCSTGGELYRLPGGKFYLCVGHRYYHFYNPNGLNFPLQQYLDSVHVFTLTETPTSISLDSSSISYISDNQPDATTQFRRRDLVVSPQVLGNGDSIGIAIYAGVFTQAGNPFTNPIYIPGYNGAAYAIDTFNQQSNYYSAPHFQLYDSTADRMYTTVFGGIGSNPSFAGDNAAFTMQIVTLNRDFKAHTTSAIYNPSEMPNFVGAEGIFIRANTAPAYHGNGYDIADIRAIPANQGVLVGYIFGGIVSNAPESTTNSCNPTAPSNVVYEVRMYKSGATK
ncbi:MAG TPA: hypothetical protein VFU15_08250 [Bacteroidia bacterium]|nr:hypothetical protein [Bacteroidia bacterium]